MRYYTTLGMTVLFIKKGKISERTLYMTIQIIENLKKDQTDYGLKSKLLNFHKSQDIYESYRNIDLDF